MNTRTADIVFALRADALAKPGGDSTKVAEYRVRVEAAGLTTAVVFDVAQLTTYRPRVVHVLNLDLPVENLAYAAAARAAGARVALSTIAHPRRGLAQFYAHGDDSYFRAARRLGVPFDYGFGSREPLKLAIRQHSARVLLNGRFSFHRAQQALVEAVDLLLPMNQAEDLELSERFSSLPPRVIVPNGTTYSPTPRAPELPTEHDVVVVGRVEPRKNTLEIARALAGCGLRVVFVGAPNRRHRRYVTAFARVVLREPEFRWLGGVPAQEVRSRLAVSDVYLNGSWCEVVSQADIEAAAQGCRLLTTRNSFITDHLTSVSMIDPRTLVPAGAGRALVERLGSATVPVPGWLPTWSEAGDALVKAYKEIS